MSNWVEACDMLKSISLEKATGDTPPATKVETPEQLLSNMKSKLSKLSGSRTTKPKSTITGDMDAKLNKLSGGSSTKDATTTKPSSTGGKDIRIDKFSPDKGKIYFKQRTSR